MHEYLRAIGFSKYKKKKEYDELVKSLIKEFEEDSSESIVNDEGETVKEIHAEIAANMGLCIHGISDPDTGELDIDYSYPYVYTHDVSSETDACAYRLVEDDRYVVFANDPKVSISLIFRLDGSLDVADKLVKAKKDIPASLYLSALCNDGKVIMPIKKTESQQKLLEEYNNKKNKLIQELKDGNMEAFEELAATEMNNFSNVTKRLHNEDIYSIVNSVFMPQGVECNVYQVLGEIKEVAETKNYLTGEEVYDLTVDSGDLMFHVAINKLDLKGEPVEGRRFKGIIWMIGRVELR